MEASTFRNYCGILMSRQGYQKYASGISEKASFMPNNNSHATRERLWFMLGRRDVIIVCVRMHDFSYDEFIEAGLIKDITNMPNFQNIDSFSDYVYHLIYGKSHRIYLCNEIRNKLSTSQKRYRWCGSENESLTNMNIIKRAIEINGMSIKHACFNSNADLLGQCMSYRHEPLFQTMRSAVQALSSEGQRKLFSCMMGFASPYVPIVYVGSSPGEGWIKALDLLDYSSEIISIDPRPLQIPLGCSLNITHYQIAILNSSDLLTICENMEFFDFIWDVRGDTNSESYEDRLHETSEEIAILNDILSNPTLKQKIRRMQIKINTCSADKYLLTDNVRLYMQPFCSSRGIYELRAVAHFDDLTTLTYISAGLVRTLHQKVVEISNSESDLDMMVNCLGMRLVRYNFLHMKSLYDARIDIALFCINWNTTEAIIEYLGRNHEESVQTICSFFTKPMLTSEEHVFPEDYLLNVGHYFVVDSRSFIKAKIECLYFVVPRMSWKMYTNEFITSETYTIKVCEKAILRGNQMSQYNKIRHDTCLESGAIFPKFPRPFSYADRLVSPSGHMLRVYSQKH